MKLELPFFKDESVLFQFDEVFVVDDFFHERSVATEDLLAHHDSDSIVMSE